MSGPGAGGGSIDDGGPPAAAPPAGLRHAVTALRLTDFRNHAALALEPGARSVVIVGDNGVGKTNVLEALSLLSPGRGLRRAARAEMLRRGAAAFAVAATVEGPYGAVRIGTGGGGEEAARSLVVDGERQRTVDVLTDHLRLLWLTPAMDGLFTGPAGDRRRFLDRMVLAIDPAHGRRVADFESALTARNRLLEDLRPDPVWLDATEGRIAELGTAVAAARREAVDCLARLAGVGADDAFPTARLALEGDVEDALAAASATDVEAWYRTDLAAGRSRDRAAGRTLTGPHRTELAVRHAGKDMPAAFASTGEQKALLIGLVLAQARLVGDVAGLTPILLLDEVAAHLDAGRRRALYDILDQLGAQVWMTGTDRAPFADLGGRALVVGL